ncbi:MAG: ribosomal protein S18-alanine N-acetyltransferase [Halioglobus sp.]|nr:ribosomal protein S18-alanine N-acetyltransferase [Halioglobus sp.]
MSMNAGRQRPQAMTEQRVALPHEFTALADLDSRTNPGPWSAARFQRICAATAQDTALVAVLAGEIAGFLVYSCILDEATVQRVGVEPTLRGRGIGGSLLDAACARVRDGGARRCLLEVRASNHVAIGLYESRGFARDGVRKGYYQGAEGLEDALLMSRSLVA